LLYEKERKKDMSALRRRSKRRAARGNETTHTHTERERERDAERRKSRRLSLSSAKKQKNTQLITPLLQAPILSHPFPHEQREQIRNEWRSWNNARWMKKNKLSALLCSDEKSLCSLSRSRLSMRQRTGKRERERERERCLSRVFFFPRKVAFYLFIRFWTLRALSLSIYVYVCVSLSIQKRVFFEEEEDTRDDATRERRSAFHTRARLYMYEVESGKCRFLPQKIQTLNSKEREKNPKLNSNVKP